MGLMADVTGQQGMLTLPRHLIPPMVCPGVRVCPTIYFVLLLGVMRLITVRYLYLASDTLTCGSRFVTCLYIFSCAGFTINNDVACKVHSLLKLMVIVTYVYSRYANGDISNSFNCLTEVISEYTEAKCPMNGDFTYMHGVIVAGGFMFGGSLTIVIFLTAKRMQRKCITEKRRVQQNVDHGYRYETNNTSSGMPLAVTGGPDENGGNSDPDENGSNSDPNENGSNSDNARSVKGSRVKTNAPFMDLSKSQSMDYSVYNHLHEKEAANMDDNYDHVEPNSSARFKLHSTSS
ncbi:uncharacterized protein LOC125655312 isoform X2 [Ostrea edulis]|uniref:uncharacterized protein LOC125655312 isoform X2 n=1 Tax=Ostrea edulis TaxID=37623 RepID=UPI0024AEB5A6|nr:uncharacterized protein LOC125655312 isoform X2 [Ostrea edulis]